MPKLMRFLIPVVCLLFVALVILQGRPSAQAAPAQKAVQGSSQSQDLGCSKCFMGTQSYRLLCGRKRSRSLSQVVEWLQLESQSDHI